MHSNISSTLDDTMGSDFESERNVLTTLERVMIAIVAVTLVSSCLLISSVEGMEAGHQPWKPGSILRIITELMSFNYNYPTPRGVEIKWLIQGLGAAAALLAGAVAWYLRVRGQEQELSLSSGKSYFGQTGEVKRLGIDFSAAKAAQLTLVLFALWSLLSVLWSPWPTAAFGEGLRQLMVTVWAVVLGRTLGRKGARGAAGTMLIVLVITAILGIWYYYERNPYQRLKFPIGNPIFLAACLLPGLMLAFCTLIGAVQGMFSSVGGWGLPADPLRPRPKGVWYSWWLIIGAAVALMILLWAFKLSYSRGPLVGLAAGLAVAIYFVLPKRYRLFFGAVIVLVLVAGGFWFMSQLSQMEGGRGATIRLRFHSMRYEGKLFLESPVVGKGQGSYMLLAQEMSLADAEKDPIAFPSELLGHAHNEWLEILADLGAIGFALMVVVLCMTFWAGTVGLRRIRNPAERFCLIGMLSAFIALIVEECTDVALRMPGLPVVFYALIGFIWGMSEESNSPQSRVTRPPGRVTRIAGLIGAFITVGGIVTVVSRDWEGALASYAIFTHADKRQWDEALSKSDIATTGRLSVTERVTASFQGIQVSYEAGAYRLDQMRETLKRLSDPQTNRLRILQIVQEDARECRRYFDRCEREAEALLSRIPGHAYVAGIVSDSYLRRQELDSIETKLGFREPPTSFMFGTDNISQAASWMEREYSVNRLNAEVGLRLCRLSVARPVDYRIDLLRIPLRSGPVINGVEAVLSAMMAEPGFEEVMNGLLAKAEGTLNAPDDISWKDNLEVYDPYAPETFRLAAVAYKLNRQFDRASLLAGKAAELSVRIGSRFPLAVSHARIEQARYLLLSRPDKTEFAVEACRQAIDAWPQFGDRDRQLEMLRKELSLYLLAADDEAGARSEIELVVGKDSPKQVQHNIGYGYLELCKRFMIFPPDSRPSVFQRWLQRSLELVPYFSNARLVAIQIALEKGDDSAAQEHLSILEEILEDPQQMWAAMQSLLSMFESNEFLRAYANDFIRRHTVTTQPSGETPTSFPVIPGILPG
ncbi:MAG: O-antigen ligase family protein [Planctomycetota bacterium]|nr:MAG: O-antigen ligase family protein [Planctomycetota bacterium]